MSFAILQVHRFCTRLSSSSSMTFHDFFHDLFKFSKTLGLVVTQHAKKVVSDSPGLVDFVIGLVNSVFNLPDGQVMFFLRNSNNRRTVKSILFVKKLLGLAEMTSGLVTASFSLPFGQAVKVIFSAPCHHQKFSKFPSFWGHFFTINCSTDTNSGVHQNASRLHCLITPLYPTLSWLCHLQ